MGKFDEFEETIGDVDLTPEEVEGKTPRERYQLAMRKGLDVYLDKGAFDIPIEYFVGQFDACGGDYLFQPWR